MNQLNGAPQTQKLTPPAQKDPVAITVATYLRYHKILKQRQGLNINSGDKQDFFRYKRLIRALLSDEYKKQQKKQPSLPPVEDNAQAQKLFILMIQNQLIQPVKKLKTQDAKQKKAKLERGVPCLEPTNKAVLQPDEYFIWTFSPPNPYLVIYSLLGLVGIFTVILFPLWPLWMRKGVWYLSTGLLGLICLFFALAIVRLIIYVLSLVFLPQQFWLFPRLFDDCGFFDSFKPLYSWEDPKGKPKKKSKKVSSETKGVSSTVDNNSSKVTKRATVEEVE
ncbi:hypothetical protein OGAPHI_004982 [Ogataea philodendri]|uniref:Translocation protein SEC62 n=1 Tax=Ogataea philodendri TaxID=1378263 RepID=A0A9P8P228_9ASCO|nr:uncharacterized protein OGAPHI_004982 [Ogataea philodendri]KAH3663581.1 hypothetical protein OGAPHI_004982 [Ogataea philodendri]